MDTVLFSVVSMLSSCSNVSIIALALLSHGSSLEGSCCSELCCLEKLCLAFVFDSESMEEGIESFLDFFNLLLYFRLNLEGCFALFIESVLTLSFGTLGSC